MSIDNYYWCPAGANDANPYPEGWAKNKPLADLPKGKEAAAQVYFSHGREYAIDEQYFFEDADSARWFWRKGWEHRQIIDSRDGTPVGYQKMALWIGDTLVDERGHSLVDTTATASTSSIPTWTGCRKECAAATTASMPWTPPKKTVARWSWYGAPMPQPPGLGCWKTARRMELTKPSCVTGASSGARSRRTTSRKRSLAARANTPSRYWGSSRTAAWRSSPARSRPPPERKEQTEHGHRRAQRACVACGEVCQRGLILPRPGTAVRNRKPSPVLFCTRGISGSSIKQRRPLQRRNNNSPVLGVKQDRPRGWPGQAPRPTPREAGDLMTTWIEHLCEMNVGWLGEHPILCEKRARFKDEHGNWRCSQHWDEQEAARAEKLMRPDEPVEDVEDL